MERRRVGMGDETPSASGLVFIRGSDLDQLIRFDRPLRIICGAAAFDADRVGLRDELSDGKQLRHRLEWLPHEILIEPGDYDPAAFGGKAVGGAYDLDIEELPFVDANDLSFGQDVAEQFSSGRDGYRRMRLARVRGNIFV